MRKADKLYEMLEEKRKKNPDVVFDMMSNSCPSDHNMKDSDKCYTLIGDCFKCWMEECEE